MDMQLNQNKQTNSGEVCGIFGVPPSMMSGNASTEAKKNFITDTLTPLLNIFETAFDSDLLLEAEKGRRYFAFDTRELTRGDILQRYQAYAIGKEKGFIQIDDIRELEDMPPLNIPFVNLGLGDVLYNPETGEIYTPNTDRVVNIRELGWSLRNNDKVETEENSEELRYNPYHDPTNGRFTTSSGGGMGAVLHVPMGAKGKGEYVFAKEYSGTDNADFANRNAKFIKINDRQRKHYNRLLEDGDITTEEYNELISELPDNIRENGSYTMVDKDNAMIKATGTLFDYDGRTYGYNHIGNNDFVTDIETSTFLPLKKYNPSFGEVRDELVDVVKTAEIVNLVAKRNRASIYNNSDKKVSKRAGELRFNPNHDPENGRFTGGQFTNGNFSSSAIRFSGGGASKGLTTCGKDDIIKATTQQRQDIKNTLKGTKTPNGIIISNVSQHAADRIIERGYSADDIKKSLTNAAITYPGNTSGTHCVQLKADDRIVYNDKGNVVTVVKLGKEEN